MLTHRTNAGLVLNYPKRTTGHPSGSRTTTIKKHPIADTRAISTSSEQLQKVSLKRNPNGQEIYKSVSKSKLILQNETNE